MSSEPAVARAGSARGIPTVDRRRWLAVCTAVFVSGGVLLGLEIAASRVLAPFFGNSLFVWGALIGVVLTGLSIGYWAGGALADRLPATRLLLGVMSLAALLVLAVPLVDEAVLEAIVRWNPGPRLNPLLAATALFGAPSVVLAAVSPIAVRLLADELTRVGRTAGRLFAVSTAGSIAGTFAAAFFLLPELGTGQLIAFGGAALLAAVTLVAATERLALPAAGAALATVAATVFALSLAPATGGRLAGVAAENWSPLYRLRGERSQPLDYASEGYDVRLRRETRYHSLAVVEDDDSRYLRFDNSFQSGMYLGRPFATRFSYTDYFGLGLAYNPGARDVLLVGLGGGSAAKRLWRDFPGLRLQAVELDPAVVDVAYRWFALPRSDRLRVAVEDGRRYLTRERQRWGVIGIDAFYADSVPFHLTTREFLEVVRERLAPGGVVAVNIIGALRGQDSQLFRSMVRTYRSVFPTVVVHPVIDGALETDVRNLILVATDRPAPDKAFLAARWRQVLSRQPGAPNLVPAIRGRYDRAIAVDDVPTLTDDYAPTDALLLVD